MAGLADRLQWLCPESDAEPSAEAGADAESRGSKAGIEGEGFNAASFGQAELAPNARDAIFTAGTARQLPDPTLRPAPPSLRIINGGLADHNAIAKTAKPLLKAADELPVARAVQKWAGNQAQHGIDLAARRGLGFLLPRVESGALVNGLRWAGLGALGIGAGGATGLAIGVLGGMEHCGSGAPNALPDGDPKVKARNPHVPLVPLEAELIDSRGSTGGPNDRSGPSGVYGFPRTPNDRNEKENAPGSSTIGDHAIASAEGNGRGSPSTQLAKTTDSRKTPPLQRWAGELAALWKERTSEARQKLQVLQLILQVQRQFLSHQRGLDAPENDPVATMMESYGLPRQMYDAEYDRSHSLHEKFEKPAWNPTPEDNQRMVAMLKSTAVEKEELDLQEEDRRIQVSADLDIPTDLFSTLNRESLPPRYRAFVEQLIAAVPTHARQVLNRSLDKGYNGAVWTDARDTSRVVKFIRPDEFGLSTIYTTLELKVWRLALEAVTAQRLMTFPAAPGKSPAPSVPVLWMEMMQLEDGSVTPILVSERVPGLPVNTKVKMVNFQSIERSFLPEYWEGVPAKILKKFNKQTVADLTAHLEQQFAYGYTVEDMQHLFDPDTGRMLLFDARDITPITSPEHYIELLTLVHFRNEIAAIVGEPPMVAPSFTQRKGRFKEWWEKAGPVLMQTPPANDAVEVPAVRGRRATGSSSRH